MDHELKSQIIQYTTSSRLRRRAIREGLELPEILKAARAYEASERAAKLIEGDTSEEVNKVRQFHKKKFTPKNDKKSRCYKCNGSWPHEVKCPASSYKCKNVAKKVTMNNAV